MMLEHSPLIDGQGSDTKWEVRWNAAPSKPSLRMRFKSCFSEILERAKKGNTLLSLTILGVICGIIIGCLGRLGSYTEDDVIIVSYLGELLMRFMKLLILPLISSSLIIGIAGLNENSGAKMRMRALIYYFSTTIFAAILGILLVIAIHPGDPSMKSNAESGPKYSRLKVSSFDTFLDLGRNMFPENIIGACFQQTETVYIQDKEKIEPPVQNANGSEKNSSGIKYKRVQQYKDGVNIIGIIVFCVLFASACGQIGEDGKLIIRFFKALNDAVMKLVNKAMWCMPLGIMLLIIGKIMSIDSLAKTAEQLGLYLITVMAGLTIHSMVTLPLIYFIAVRQNPFKVVKGMFQAILTAIGTSSSAATLPITFQCLENNLNFDKRVTRFVLPVGATINMDGTALYEAVAAIFIAQVNGIELSFQDICTISLTSTAASIGAASMPSAGLVTMLIVLGAAHLPTSDVSLIIAVDWFLDRFRTAINVLGDAYGAGIVYHLSKVELDLVDENNAPRVELEMTEDSILPSNRN